MTRASGACGRKESVLALVENQLAAAHAQNEREGNEIKSLRAEVELTAASWSWRLFTLASMGFFLTIVMGASARARALRRTGMGEG